MKNAFKIYLLIICLFFVAACNNCAIDNRQQPFTPTNQTRSDVVPPKILIKNKYLQVSEHYEEQKRSYHTKYEINEEITKPVFIKADGEAVDNLSLEDINFDNISDFSHLALPASDELVKKVTTNPFMDKDFITPLTPSIYGKYLNHKKTDKNTVLFALNDYSEAKEKVIDEEKLKETFPDYDKNLLGEGGEGSVYKVTFDGQDYALKENAKEYKDLEKLQFTNAVAKVFGTFKVSDKPYMIMEMGQKTLADMNKNGEKLSDEQIKEIINNFTSLMDVEKKLNIENNDIKPANLLLTQDNKLVVIDTSSAFTKEYSGLESQKLVRSLLENKLGISMKGGYINLHRFFQFRKKYINNMIISSELLARLYKIICADLKIDNQDCAQIKSFEELFQIIPQNKIYEIAEQINAVHKDNSGTHDLGVFKGGIYKSLLPTPWVQELDDNNWEEYFKQKEKIADLFCDNIMDKDASDIEKKLKLTYEKFCILQNDEYKINKEFISSKDKEFRQFIKDAYLDHAYKQTIQQILYRYSINDIIKNILNNELDQNDEVTKLLIELYEKK